MATIDNALASLQNTENLRLAMSIRYMARHNGAHIQKLALLGAAALALPNDRTLHMV